MAGGSALILLIDEIATMVKVTAEKTESITKPVHASPGHDKPGNVYFKHDTRLILDIAKGSLRNKALLVPAALALNWLAPWAVLPLVAAGGVYFSRAGIEKLRKTLKGETEAHITTARDNLPTDEARALKVKQALRTDMILSAEIVAITLALVATMPFASQAAIMSGVAVGATAAAYSVITGIIKMEDLGGWMANRQSPTVAGNIIRRTGNAILRAKPQVMNAISTAGTAAIFMVGGSLIFHGIPTIGYGVSETLASFISSPYAQSVVKLGAGFVTGLGVGLTVNAVEKGIAKTAAAILPAHSKETGLEKIQGAAKNLRRRQQSLQQTVTFRIENIRQRFNTKSAVHKSDDTTLDPHSQHKKAANNNHSSGQTNTVKNRIDNI